MKGRTRNRGCGFHRQTRTSIEDELLASTSPSEGALLSSGKYKRKQHQDADGVLQSKGFNQVKVTPQFAMQDNNIVVTFVVNEGPPRHRPESLQVEGNDTMSLDRLARMACGSHRASPLRRSPSTTIETRSSPLPGHGH